MKEYLVCEIANLCDVSLAHARRFTEEEKTHYATRYREKGFVGVSDSIRLEEIKFTDVKNILGEMHEDGSFFGCSNSAYIITEEQWNQLVELNNQGLAEKEQKEISDQIGECNKIISACENQDKLYTDEEAADQRAAYNAFHNEGGEGFVPHFYTIDEYNRAKEQLESLLK